MTRCWRAWSAIDDERRVDVGRNDTRTGVIKVGPEKDISSELRKIESVNDARPPNVVRAHRPVPCAAQQTHGRALVAPARSSAGRDDDAESGVECDAQRTGVVGDGVEHVAGRRVDLRATPTVSAEIDVDVAQTKTTTSPSSASCP